MGRSRATKDELLGDGCQPRRNLYKNGCRVERHAEGEDVNKWMQGVHPKKGALHKAMHIPKGKKIPTAALEKETHSKSPLMRKRANLALRYRGR